ncbi:fibrobacter succinogenes major paralogous domain-containing protein [Fibrobacter sp. UWEL]|uniref:fibrobacter succinogenes major paralogous domain-containing protein n=1 Tax=Fibrobacter sp. UWEL TaxID=1896209 RepID=UPI00091D064E|nr:fibrobacter succinogenes major paralogous domain-containing protein [Fibrobacter sp. UWEL]SHK96622.1 major paralogous domain-containing protein [Fibrobacter sp. UWEL]
MKKLSMIVYAVSMVFALCTLVSCSSNFTDDRDGQSYSVVEIAGQLWMAENLNYAGSEVAAGSFCPDGDDRNCKKYGRLYTWEAAKVACPAGWRLPTAGDFQKLIAAADPASENLAAAGNKAGSALKASSGWFKKGDGKDALGFAALPAGYMTAADPSEGKTAGKFDGIGGYAHLWSETADPQESAFAQYLYLDFSSDAARISSFSATDARSVRCVKN